MLVPVGTVFKGEVFNVELQIKSWQVGHMQPVNIWLSHVLPFLKNKITNDQFREVVEKEDMDHSKYMLLRKRVLASYFPWILCLNLIFCQKNIYHFK